MPSLLNLLLSRWELDPATIAAPEANGRLKEVFGVLQSETLVRPVASDGAADCRDCGCGCPVAFVQDAAGASRGYIHCPDCGPMEIPLRMLDRWEIDARALLAAIFRDAKLAIELRTPPHLWRIGKATWAGRSREIWFARAFRRRSVAAAIDVLRARPKAVFFAPTELGAARWRDATGGLVIALASAVDLGEGRIDLDVAYVEGQIVDTGLGQETGEKKRKTPKRANRAADIEMLREALIEHLRAARDHARTTGEQFGEPRLLPRPTQEALGRMVGISEPSRVSRCLKDETAAELRMLWEAALDLDRISDLGGRINGRRRA